MKLLFLIPSVLILTGCLSPATPDDIKAAKKKCPDVGWSIEFELQPCDQFSCVKKLPLTKSRLDDLVEKCINNGKNLVKPSSTESIINAQRAAAAVE